MCICAISLGLKSAHIGDSNGSRQKLNVIGIGIEAICERDHGDPCLGKLSSVRDCKAGIRDTYNINKQPKEGAQDNHRSSSHKDKFEKPLHRVCV